MSPVLDSEAQFLPGEVTPRLPVTTVPLNVGLSGSLFSFSPLLVSRPLCGCPQTFRCEAGSTRLGSVRVCFLHSHKGGVVFTFPGYYSSVIPSKPLN